jgi:hypothetical protein
MIPERGKQKYWGKPLSQCHIFITNITPIGHRSNWGYLVRGRRLTVCDLVGQTEMVRITGIIHKDPVRTAQ